jgi:hypothetical protein
MIAEESPFEQTISHSTHNNHLTRVQEYENQCHTVDMQIADVVDGDRIDSFSPSAMPLDAQVFRHSTLHITVFADAVALLAAFSLTASAPHPSISIRQSARVEPDCVVVTELPTPAPIPPEHPNDLLLPYDSTGSLYETVPKNAPSFRRCVLLLEIPSFQTSLLVLGCHLG